jgi:hypothetical protein
MSAERKRRFEPLLADTIKLHAARDDTVVDELQQTFEPALRQAHEGDVSRLVRWLRNVADFAADEHVAPPIDPTQLERLADFVSVRTRRQGNSGGKPKVVISELDFWERRIVAGARRFRQRTGCTIKEALKHQTGLEQERDLLDADTERKIPHARMVEAMKRRRSNGSPRRWG